MAINNPPAFMQNAGSTHNADLTRQAVAIGQAGPRVASSLVPRSGVHPHLGGALQVTQNGSPNMTVNVASGVAVIAGTEGATQADYVVVAPSTTNLGLTAAHASLPRIDIVVAEVRDSAYSGANNDWQLRIVAGTAAGSPVAPATPANAIVLAQLAVSAADTSIVTADITDVRPYSSVGIIYVKDTNSYPSPAMGGMVCYVKSTGQLAVYNENTATWSNPDGAQFLQQVRFTASGSFTKATYPGLKKARVQVQGGGGAGGGVVAAPAGQVSAGGGGQGGSYAESWVNASSMAASVTVTVGAGGSGVVGGAGLTGGQSSFGTTVIAAAGAGGLIGNPGSTLFGQQGGTGAQSMTGDIQIPGSAGAMGARLGTLAGQHMGGIGGPSHLGNGGEAGRNANGGVGKGFGGGGGGATCDPSGSSRAGGDGAPGVVILDLYV